MDFYKSRKFWYNALAFIAAVVMATVPVMFDMSSDNAATFRLIVPFVLGMGIALSTKHTFMDAFSIAKSYQVPSVDDALGGVIDAIENP